MKDKKVVKDAKLNYSPYVDIFYARPISRDFSESVSLGDLILDLDKSGDLVGIEILNAAKLFGVDKQFLSKLKTGKVDIYQKDGILRINITLVLEVRNGEKNSALSIERIKPEFLEVSSLQMATA